MRLTGASVFYKILLLAFAGKWFAITFLPPTPPTKKILRVNFFELYLPYIVVTMVTSIWAIAAFDALVSSIRHFSPHLRLTS